MRRREFMAVLAGAITITTRRDAGAQQTPRVWRIGILDTAPRQLNGPNLASFYKRLQELGYVEGENLKVVGRHTHPGPESGYLLEGDFTLLVEGQPDKPLKVGESYQVPSGTIHDARTGAQGAKVIATYVVEKGKPLASPAP